MNKKRRYLEVHLKFSFSSVISKGIEKPQCALCNAVLSAESLKPSKLKRLLDKNHPNHVTKDLQCFRRHEAGLKRQKLSRLFTLQEISS